MILQRLVNVVAFAGAFYATHKLGVWFDPVDSESIGSTPEETVKISGQPVETKNDDSSFFTEEDKRRLQRAKEDLEKKCSKHGLCDPPSKSLTETISDAFYDTYLALMKIPSYWKRTADDIGERIARFFGDD